MRGIGGAANENLIYNFIKKEPKIAINFLYFRQLYKFMQMLIKKHDRNL